jgi:CRP-like cAMP-binding protein
MYFGSSIEPLVQGKSPTPSIQIYGNWAIPFSDFRIIQCMTGPVSIAWENRPLASLPASDFELLHRHLERELLVPHSVIYEPGVPITKVYFPQGGAISLVIVMLDGQTIETGMIGRNGILGGFAALGGLPACHRTVVQIECTASVIDVEPLRQAANESEAIRSLLIRHEQALSAQAQQSAACNAAHPLEARLCHWLLRAHDACGQFSLRINQKLIADLLGVRRTSVSCAAQSMQQRGLIRTCRGRIELLDLVGLKQDACECYANVAMQYDRLSGSLARYAMA